MGTKITVATITGGYASVDALNTALGALSDEFDKCIYRDGESPNTWTAAQDANNQRLLNLIDATTNSEPVTYGQWQTGLYAGGGGDHGQLLGLADDDHTIYLLADGTRSATGAFTFNNNLTVDGNTDLGADYTNTTTVFGTLTANIDTGYGLTVHQNAGGYLHFEALATGGIIRAFNAANDDVGPLAVSASTFNFTLSGGGSALSIDAAYKAVFGGDIETLGGTLDCNAVVANSLDINGSSTIGAAVNNTHDFQGIVSIETNNPLGLSIRAAATGDRLVLGANATPGNGAEINSMPNAQDDYEPLVLRAESFTFGVRTGVLTAANQLVVNSTGVSVLGNADLGDATTDAHTISGALVQTIEDDTYGWRVKGTTGSVLRLYIPSPGDDVLLEAMNAAETAQAPLSITGSSLTFYYSAGGGVASPALAIDTAGSSSFGENAFEVYNGIASSVNFIRVQGAATGGFPYLGPSTDSGDTNVDMAFYSKGTGNVRVFSDTGGVEMARFVRVATADRFLTFTPSNGGNPAIDVSGGNLKLGGATDIQWGVALVALGGGAVPTLGTIGGTGPAAAAQNTWMRVLDSTGAAFWVPAWK